MLRGINRQQIFEDAEDCYKFLTILREYKGICEYSVYAYCLMGNHIHLLLKEGTESLEQVFKRVCGKFVYWYNSKYQRVGHLFQDRFKSEPVDSQEYLQTVLRYIHQNDVPEKSEIRLTDEQVSVLMLKLSKCQNATQFQELEPAKQEKYLRKLRQEGVSIRQLSRMTGISIGVIRKYG